MRPGFFNGFGQSQCGRSAYQLYSLKWEVVTIALHLAPSAGAGGGGVTERLNGLFPFKPLKADGQTCHTVLCKRKEQKPTLGRLVL